MLRSAPNPFTLRQARLGLAAGAQLAKRLRPPARSIAFKDVQELRDANEVAAVMRSKAGGLARPRRPACAKYPRECSTSASSHQGVA
eukprot:353214-Chlamydomonas_euryale.AAC.6